MKSKIDILQYEYERTQLKDAKNGTLQESFVFTVLLVFLGRYFTRLKPSFDFV